MELVQFHPTGMLWPEEVAGTLVTEAVRGEGGIRRNAGGISREPMEVAPTAHYSMGGVVVDTDTTATDVEGLFAAGEVTSSLHGANRLGEHSLTEILVFGRRAGEQAARVSTSRDVSIHPRGVISDAAGQVEAMVRKGDELARPMQRAIRDLLWERCGVLRDAAGLERGLEELDVIADGVADVDVSPNEEGWRISATCSICSQRSQRLTSRSAERSLGTRAGAPTNGRIDPCWIHPSAWRSRRDGVRRNRPDGGPAPRSAR